MSPSDVTYCLTGEQLYGLAFQAAAIASGAVIRESPDVAIPSEEIHGDLIDLMTDFLAPIPDRYQR